MGTESQFYKMKRALEMDGGDGSTLWKYLIQLNTVTTKNG